MPPRGLGESSPRSRGSLPEVLGMPPRRGPRELPYGGRARLLCMPAEGTAAVVAAVLACWCLVVDATTCCAMKMCAVIVRVSSCISCLPTCVSMPVAVPVAMTSWVECNFCVEPSYTVGSRSQQSWWAWSTWHSTLHYSLTEFHGPNVGPCRGTGLQGPSCETHSAVAPQVGSSLGPTMRSGIPDYFPVYRHRLCLISVGVPHGGLGSFTNCWTKLWPLSQSLPSAGVEG